VQSVALPVGSKVRLRSAAVRRINSLAGRECRPGSAPMCGDWVRLMGEWWTCVRCCRRIDWTIELDATEWEVLEDGSMSCEACLTPEELQALCEEAEVVRGTDCERCRRRFEDGAFPDEVHGWIEVDDGGLILPWLPDLRRSSHGRLPHGDRTPRVGPRPPAETRSRIAGFLATWAASLA